jgi:hypothetical protein
MGYSYEIEPRTPELGGGWRLRLLEDGEEVGGGVFPADPHADPVAGMAWFNGLSEPQRAEWLAEAESARAVDAWGVWLASEARCEAEDVAHEWLSSRGDDE